MAFTFAIPIFPCRRSSKSDLLILGVSITRFKPLTSIHCTHFFVWGSRWSLSWCPTALLNIKSKLAFNRERLSSRERAATSSLLSLERSPSSNSSRLLSPWWLRKSSSPLQKRLKSIKPTRCFSIHRVNLTAWGDPMALESPPPWLLFLLSHTKSRTSAPRSEILSTWTDQLARSY